MIAISQIWITLGPVVVFNSILITSYIAYQILVGRRDDHEFAGAKRGGSKILGSATREWWFWTTNPIVKLFVKLHMTPNILTATGFFFSCVAAYLFAVGLFGYAGWMMIFGASFDMFDGRVARITGKTSRSGAYFDAVMDRFGEGACMLGLAFYFRDSWMMPIVIIGLVGSLLVSYTKARAEGMGVECNVGWMQRPERIVYIGVSSVLDPCANIILKNWWESPLPILVIMALIWIAIMTNATAIYRMIFTMNKLDTADKREKESLSQIITRLSTPSGREEFWSKTRFGYDRSKGDKSHVVLFLVNGLDVKLFGDLLKRGDLPNISKHILERGCKLDATSVFPSTVATTTIPFVTGCFPGTCDIPGVRWFDRSISAARLISMNRFRDYIGWGAYVMDHDLSKSVRTIFEYSKQAVNIFGMVNRGCGLVRDPAFFSLKKQFEGARNAFQLDVAYESAFTWFSSAIKKETDFVLYSFPQIKSSEYKTIDNYVGKAAQVLKDNGMYDDTVMLFASSHGEGIKNKTLDIEQLFSKKYKVSGLERGLKSWNDSNIITLPSGTSMTHLYVRNSESWNNRTFFEEVERKGIIGSLLEQDGIDIIAGRSIEGGIVVQSTRGRSHILEDADGRITYMTKGGCPFGFEGLPQVMDSSSVYEITSNTPYPDGIVQIAQLFRSRRTGDIVVSCNSDTSIMKDSDRYTDGSLCESHIKIPLISSVPLNGKNIRSADIFALVLDLLGIETEHTMDAELNLSVTEKKEDVLL